MQVSLRDIYESTFSILVEKTKQRPQSEGRIKTISAVGTDHRVAFYKMASRCCGYSHAHDCIYMYV